MFKRCKQCGIAFDTSKSNVKYCSDKCREDVKISFQKASRHASRSDTPCAYCGRLFLRANGRKYCGDECATLGKIKKTKEFNDRTKLARAGLNLKLCVICGTSFKPNTRGIYCSVACKVEGLRKAVERQRERRELNKKNNC